MNIPERFKIVQLSHPQTTNGGFTSDYVSLKNANRATIIVEINQAVGHATAFTLNRATAVDGTGATTLANNVKVRANDDVAASDALVVKTDAKAYTVANDIKKKQIVFEIDPAGLGDTYDVICVVAADSSQATNFASITALLEMRYQQATPPAAITD